MNRDIGGMVYANETRGLGNGYFSDAQSSSHWEYQLAQLMAEFEGWHRRHREVDQDRVLIVVQIKMELWAEMNRSKDHDCSGHGACLSDRPMEGKDRVWLCTRPLWAQNGSLRPTILVC